MKFQLLVLVFGIGSVLGVVSAKSILNDNKQASGSLGRHRRDGTTGSSAGAQLNKTMASTTEKIEILLKELTTQGTTTERNNIFNRGKQRLQDHVNRLLNTAVGITRRVEQFLRGSFNNSFGSSNARDSSRGILDSIFGNRKPNLTA